jgi:hypothetical protein
LTLTLLNNQDETNPTISPLRANHKYYNLLTG